MSHFRKTGFSKTTYPYDDRADKAERDVARLDHDQIVEATDIESLVSEFVELRPQGSRMVGLCPFHSDSSPSFTVTPGKGVYGCWSCDAGLNGKQSGNAVSFVRRYFNLDYRDALVYLADRAGIPVDDRLRNSMHSARAPQRPATPKPVKQHVAREDEPNKEADKDRVAQTMSRAFHGYAKALRESPEAIQYLTATRGISPSVLAKFAIGFAPDGFNFLSETLGDSYEKSRDGFDAGLVRLSAKGNRYDFFRNRLMFGLRNDDGDIVAFGGRAMGPLEADGRRTPKYINSPETAIFSKSNELFGFYENKSVIEQADMALVMEGYMDVVALASHGIPLGVACMGTALTDQHAQKLLSCARRITFCFDADKAGQDAALRSMLVAINQGGLEESLRFMQLPEGNDPDTFVRKHGKAAFEREVANSLSTTQFWRKALSSRFPNASDADALWQFAEQSLRDMKHPAVKESLLQVAAKLANKPIKTTQKKDPYVQAGQKENKDQRGFATASPSQSIFQAVMMCPSAGREVQPHLVQVANAFTAVKSVSSKWLMQFDAAINAGEHQKPAITDSELEHYRRKVQAAPFVLQKVCESAQQKQRQQQMDEQGLNEREQIQENRKNLFSRPR